jgi:serine/threonine protein phosphatase PrpC
MIQTFSFSDKGPRVENQDFYCLEVLGDRLLAAVADGVGGNNGGEVASRFAIEMVLDGIHKGTSLNECVDSAHHGILTKAEGVPELQGMATTLTALVCNGTALTGVHCGDSRAYILRGNGLKQITTDHTEVARLLSEGRLTKEEAVDYPRKNVITSALGTNKELIKQFFEFDLLPGDRLLLLTDGVHSQLLKPEIQRQSAITPDLNVFCKNLLAEVVNRGVTDNFTLLGVQFD